jgi:alkyl sulfatase BDS1-like metallo-beta-lactamase superfamily hydrolase
MSDERQDASQFTKAANDALLDELPFEYKQDFEDAARGFLAPLAARRSPTAVG